MSKEIIALEDLNACKLKIGTCLWYVKNISEHVTDYVIVAI